MKIRHHVREHHMLIVFSSLSYPLMDVILIVLQSLFWTKTPLEVTLFMKMINILFYAAQNANNENVRCIWNY